MICGDFFGILLHRIRLQIRGIRELAILVKLIDEMKKHLAYSFKLRDEVATPSECVLLTPASRWTSTGDYFWKFKMEDK